MRKRSLLLAIALLFIMPLCHAEIIRLGETQCLLQAPSGEDPEFIFTRSVIIRFTPPWMGNC